MGVGPTRSPVKVLARAVGLTRTLFTTWALIFVVESFTGEGGDRRLVAQLNGMVPFVFYAVQRFETILSRGWFMDRDGSDCFTSRFVVRQSSCIAWAMMICDWCATWA